MQSEISVIIPTYNRSQYICRAIDSVLLQSFTNYEIIVVDDGSTDNTKEVLKPYLSKIKYIYKENGGVSSARNFGIKEAKGRWIAFLDSDDYWKVEKLLLQKNFLEEQNLQICFTAIEIINADTEFPDKVTDRTIDNVDTVKVYDESFELVLWNPECICIQSMLIEKQLLLDVGCFDKTFAVAEDTKLVFELALNNKFGLINEPLTVLEREGNRQGLINGSLKTKNKLCDGHIEIISNTIDGYNRKNKKIIRKLKRMLGVFLSQKALYYCCNKRDGYLKYAFDALCMRGGGNADRRALAVLLAPFLVRFFLKKKYKNGL